MNIIKTAVRWRHGTLALFCILILLGILSISNLPLELQPGAQQSEIVVTTPYSGASPSEVEDLVTRPLEDVLEQVQGVQEMTSSSTFGSSTINLEFEWDSDIDRHLIDVINKLQQADELPEEAEESNIEVINSSDSPMMWVIIAPQEGYIADDKRYRDLVDDIIVPRFRQVEGVGQFLISGGLEREVEVVVDPQALSDFNLTIIDVVNTLRNNNKDIRGGPLVLGRREYRVRTVSRSTDIEGLEDFIIRRDESGTVYLGDIAQAKMGRKIQDRALILGDKPLVAVGIIRQAGANVPVISEKIREAIADLQTRFNRENEGISFIIPYDENDYINQSIFFVQQNMVIGAILASIILLLFLGSIRTVAVITLTIPTTIITAFFILAFLDRSLNVFTLAGLAFAVGMVVDNAIVVLENIFTHVQRGKTPVRAAIDGTQEVWSAMLASTLTTVVVFTPITLVKGEAGELFFDIGITLSCAVLFSLFTALTLVPMLSGLFLDRAEAQHITSEEQNIRDKNWLEQSVYKSSVFFRLLESKIELFILKTTKGLLIKKHVYRRFFVLAIPVILIWVSINILPPADYLPEGNRNLILWLSEPYPGTSIPEAIKLSEKPRHFVNEQPEIARTIYIHRPDLKAIGGFLDPNKTTGKNLNEIVERLRAESYNFPGYRFMIPTRASIFTDSGKEFEVQLIGEDLEQLNNLQQNLMKQLKALDGVESVRSNFVMGASELQVIPNRERLAEVKLTESEIGAMVQAALGGLKTSKFIDGKRELDVTLELQDSFVETPKQLSHLPLYTGNGQQVQLMDVAEVRENIGPDAINHVDLERAITFIVRVKPDASLGALVEETEQQIINPLNLALPSGFQIKLAGSADVLSETLFQLSSSFVLSLLITYLLLVALYKSFFYPFVIMATVPMGISGGLLSLVIANFFSDTIIPMNVITSMGFVILTGVVVNNAILLVDRSLQLQKQGIDYNDSLYYAVKERLRPIFMSAGTSVLGILPLSVLTGKGAELYQGLGIVLTGGLTLSAFLTPIVIPTFMTFLHYFGIKRTQKLIQKEDTLEKVSQSV